MPFGPEQILRDFRAWELSLALRTAIELDLFTALGRGQAPAPPLIALCDCLTIHGYLRKRQGRYRLAPHAAAYLSRDSAAYFGQAVHFLAGNDALRAFTQLRHTIKRGRAPAPHANFWATYATAMAPLARPVAEWAADVLAAAEPTRILDLGAGHGLYGIALAARLPNAHVDAIDSSRVLAIARKNARAAGVRARYRVIPGDATRLPIRESYDLILAANLCHHLDPAANFALLQKCRAALADRGRLAIIDFFPNPDRLTPPADASFALTLQATSPHGRLFSRQEMTTLLRKAGFTKVRQPRRGGYSRWLLIASA